MDREEKVMGVSVVMTCAAIRTFGSRPLRLAKSRDTRIAAAAPQVGGQAIGRVIRELRERGFTVVMVEQNFRFAAPLADRFYVMEGGRMVESFDTAQLRARMGGLQARLGV